MVGPAAVSYVVASTGLVLLMALALGVLGLLWPGNGAAQLDWRPSRTPEQAAADEIEDLQQMLHATNERRRRRGADDLTEDELQARVLRDRAEEARRIAAREADA